MSIGEAIAAALVLIFCCQWVLIWYRGLQLQHAAEALQVAEAELARLKLAQTLGKESNEELAQGINKQLGSASGGTAPFSVTSR